MGGEGGRLPLEEALRERLELRLRACKEGEVPFRTFHKLAALLAMRSGFARSCFDAAGRGTAGRVERWLRQVILAQAENMGGTNVFIGAAHTERTAVRVSMCLRTGGATRDRPPPTIFATALAITP